jgi:hypothetical protein
MVVRLLLALSLMLSLWAGGSCVDHGARAGGDADASIAGIRAEFKELSAALVQVRSEARAGRDIQQNDPWTLRLLGLAVMMLGLSYPVGKLIWLSLARRERGRPAGATGELELLSPFKAEGAIQSE